MTCTLMTDKDGNRMIVCRRGVGYRPHFADEAAVIVPPGSPWQIGARVKHARYGHGWITQRHSEAISVKFDDPSFVSDRTFLLAFVGKAMAVVP